jgi:DNA-binding CsgD family transcriptional regulator
MVDHRSRGRSLADLIASAYEWALDEVAIQTFLARLTRSVGGCAGNLVFYAPEQDVGVLAASYNVHGEALRLYGEHFWNVDVWRIAGERAPVGRALVGRALVPRDIFLKSEIYNDLFRRYDDIMHFCGGKIFARGASGAAISVTRSRRQGSFGGREIATMNAVLPHIRRAFELRLRFKQMAGRGEAALDLLDRRSDGVVVIGQGKLVHATPRARQRLDAGHLLHFADGRLRARVPAVDARLAAILEVARQPRAPAVVDVPDRDGAPALRLTILATDGAVPVLARQGGELLLVIDDATAAPAARVDAVAAAHGLTPAETLLLAQLAGGKTLREAAERRRISVHTARNQVKHILHKTDCRRQAELLRLCLRPDPPATPR